MPVEQRSVLAGEALFAMMNFLVSDVIPDVAILEWSDTEGSVAVLPPEFAPMRKAVMNPLRGGGFDVGHQLGERQGAWRLQIQMDVVSHTTGAQKLATPFRYNRGGTCKQAGPPFWVEPRPPVLGGPD